MKASPMRLGRALLVAALPALTGACAAPEAATSSTPQDDSATIAGQGAAPDPGPAPAAAGGPMRGIDVSHYSGSVDWQAVADAGYAFAFVKATEGEDARDPRFADHWQALASTDVERGAYHFYVAHDDPEVQARFFLDTVPFHESDLLPVVDVESPSGAPPPADFAARLRRFLELVEEETGARAIIYTGPKFWQTHLSGDFSDYPLWVAEYDVDTPVTPEGFDRWTLWQMQGDAEVEGVEKAADVSHLATGLTLEMLRMPVRDEPASR